MSANDDRFAIDSQGGPALNPLSAIIATATAFIRVGPGTLLPAPHRRVSGPPQRRVLAPVPTVQDRLFRLAQGAGRRAEQRNRGVGDLMNPVPLSAVWMPSRSVAWLGKPPAGLKPKPGETTHGYTRAAGN